MEKPKKKFLTGNALGPFRIDLLYGGSNLMLQVKINFRWLKKAINLIEKSKSPTPEDANLEIKAETEKCLQR